MHDIKEVTLLYFCIFFSFADWLIRIVDLKLKEGCAPKEIHNRLKNVYEDAVMDISIMRCWVKKFRNRETETADKRKIEQPTTWITNVNRERADELHQRDRRVIVQKVADTVNLSYSSAQGIIADFGYNKVCAKCVSKQWTVDNRRRRVEVCQKLLDAFEDAEQEFFKNMVTGHKKWAYLYDPESKVQGMAPHWFCKTFKSTRWTQKVMTTVFWGTSDVIRLIFCNIIP